jgi:monoamine oxidase
MAADLSGITVLVAGAGLAGLAAAHDLARWGADVTIVDARERAGGRVLTARQGFADGQHAEAGGDMIDEAQHAIRDLARELNLPLVPILRTGFGYVRQAAGGPVRVVPRPSSRGWDRLARTLAPLTGPYLLAERRWDTPIANELARWSVARWLDAVNADDELRATTLGLRGFFLADPDELSLLALVDQFSEDDWPGPGRMFRLRDGNDRLATTLAARLGDRVRLNTELVAISQRGRGVRATLKHSRQTSQLAVDYLVVALPATLLRRIPITPALPARQHEAIAQLAYGRGTKTLIQFPRRFWRAPRRPLAFGSPLSWGAVWDGNEQQRGRSGILSLLAGGSASDATADLVSREGVGALGRALAWLGSTGVPITASHQVRWELEPWSRGGYAVFDPSFPPSLRAWLARPAGRLFFAGEHTSIQWQGYMNGAVESGRRAAAEIAATHRLAP